MWFIIDGTSHIATGCSAHEVESANQKLTEYLLKNYQPARKERDIEDILIADVLSIYSNDCAERQANPDATKFRLARLNEFWGAMKLSEINGDTCREYVQWTPPSPDERPSRRRASESTGGRRRDLEDLRAAVNHHSKEGFHRGVVRITLPPKGQPRDRWLTRDEAAALLWACWTAREVQTQHRGRQKGRKIVTDKRPLRHVARFILIALYTGTRASAVASASPVRAEGRSFVDLQKGMFYRLADGKRVTNKRQPPVPLPSNLLAHMRRWVEKKIAKQHFVEWHDKPVKSVTTGFRHAVRLAKLEGGVTPHTLRHTAATWLMEAGVSLWEASRFLGMTQATLEKVYGHHAPDHLRNAANAIAYRPRHFIGEKLAAKNSVENNVRSLRKSGGPAWTRTRNQTVMSGRL